MKMVLETRLCWGKGGEGRVSSRLVVTSQILLNCSPSEPRLMSDFTTTSISWSLSEPRLSSFTTMWYSWSQSEPELSDVATTLISWSLSEPGWATYPTALSIWSFKVSISASARSTGYLDSACSIFTNYTKLIKNCVLYRVVQLKLYNS